MAADMVVSPQMAVADGSVMTGMGPSGGADLTAGIVSALKDVLSDQKGRHGGSGDSCLSGKPAAG